MSIESSKITLANTAGKSLVGWIVLGVGGISACCFFQPKETLTQQSTNQHAVQIGQPIQALSVSADLVGVGETQTNSASVDSQSYVQNIGYSTGFSTLHNRAYFRSPGESDVTLESDYPAVDSQLPPMQSMLNIDRDTNESAAGAMVQLPPSPTAAGHPAVVPPLANELFGRRMARSDRGNNEIYWPDEDYVPARRELAISNDSGRSRLVSSGSSQPNLINQKHIGQLISGFGNTMGDNERQTQRSVIRQPNGR